MEIGAEPRYPTPCMLLTANTGVPEFGIQNPARAREIIELFRLQATKNGVIGPLVAATISDCRSVFEVSEPVGWSSV